MFKIGDKIILIRSWDGDPENTIYTITNNGYGIPVWTTSSGRGWVTNTWAGDCPFILYKQKELKSEIDYLNAFQENFKEGV